MIYLDVDTAVTVPVNAMPLTDDTDFKSREIAIAYNESGMDLVWNFVTPAGPPTQTAVTPTTAGDYDWTNIGDAMYGLGMTASGGASINNDTEGVGYFSGVCDGVLPWRGPDVVFRAAGLNDALIESAYSATRGLTGTAVPDAAADAAGGLPISDAGGLDMDGLATSSELIGITNSGAAVSTTASSYVLTTGTQSSGTITSTEALDGTNHEHTDTAGAMDLYYEFLIGAGSPSSAKIDGYLNGNNDNLEIYGYDWIAAGWVQIGTLVGKAASINETDSYDLTTSMVGTGADLGKVRVRFTDGAFTLTSATLAIDRILLNYNQAAGGYTDGIEVDTNASNTNTQPGTDGVKGNPVSTWAAALTLSTSTGITDFRIINGSSITLTGNSDNFTMRGSNWSLALGGQSIVGIYVGGAAVSGIAAGTGATQTFSECIMGATTHIKGTHILGSAISGTQTLGEAGDHFWDRCHSGFAGTGTPVFDFGAAIGTSNLNIRNYSGGVQLEAMGDTGTDTASIEGRGQVVEGTCTGGTVAVRGMFTVSGITNLTLSDDARIDVDQITLASGAISTILNIQPLVPDDIGLADTKAYRLGLMLINSIDDLPTTGEITPGTISIDRAAPEGTSWSAVVTDAACSESAGLVYYDEVFDAATGYLEGDELRITFKSQKITVSANDYEITDSTGRIFYARIGQQALVSAKLPLITVESVNVVSAVNGDGQIRDLHRARGHETAPIDIPIDGTVIDLSGSGVTLELRLSMQALATQPSGFVSAICIGQDSITSGGTASQKVRFTPTATELANAATNGTSFDLYPQQTRYYAYSYHVVRTDTTDDEVVARGVASVIDDIAACV